MPIKPSTASGYAAGTRSLVEATCLYVATKLGDIMDELVIVGGLVPSLIIAQDNPPPGAETHVGTMDLDIGLSVALITEHRYGSLTDRLRGAGFSPGTNDQGNTTRQRWQIDGQIQFGLSQRGGGSGAERSLVVSLWTRTASGWPGPQSAGDCLVRW
jgi:hypothetical protein